MKIIYCVIKIEKSKNKINGRIYKIIQSRTQTQDKIAKYIIQLVILQIPCKLNHSNDRYIHTYLYLIIFV